MVCGITGRCIAQKANPEETETRRKSSTTYGDGAIGEFAVGNGAVCNVRGSDRAVQDVVGHDGVVDNFGQGDRPVDDIDGRDGVVGDLDDGDGLGAQGLAVDGLFGHGIQDHGTGRDLVG